MPQRVSSAGLGFLASEEWNGRNGLRNGLYYPYPDPEGFPTFGVGHLVRLHEDFSKGRTLAEVFAQFRADVERFEKAIDDGITVALADHQRGALLSFLYNEGESRAQSEKCTATRMLNLGRYDLWPSLILVYDVTNGKHTGYLKARRIREGAWFSTPDPTYAAPADETDLTDAEKAEVMHSVSSTIWANLPPV